MAYFVSWYWDRGNVRKKNEDSFSAQRVRLNRQEAAFLIVCDGIGGMPEGETASGFVTEQMTEWFYRKGIRAMRGIFWRTAVANQAKEALAGIQERMELCEREEKICCGTTATMAFVKRKKFVILHSGDSSAWLVGRRTRMLTRVHQEKGALNRCIGAFEFVPPDVCKGHLRRSNLLLLCTDGFYRLAPEGFFQGSLFAGEREKALLYKRLKGMGSFLKAQGETDNLTAVVLGFAGEERPV